jgi:serine/threonine protein kinase
MPQVRAAARPTTLGHYTLIERIGTGGQGEVWKAHDESRGVDIALKVLAPSAARNPAAWMALEREHAISSRLQHPGILQILPPERCGDAVVLPMELAAGGDLRRLRGAGYLEIVPALLEAAEALEYAHARGVVHRDLKPGNVLLDSRGRVKLADFGIAALLPAMGAGAGAAAPHAAGHSPFSASPEQLRGEPPSPADDIYSLGALAYELLSGHPPYDPNFDLQRAQTQPVPELVPTRQIPPELGELVMRMLAKRAAQRPSSMQQVMDELDATLNATLSFAPEGVEADEVEGAQMPKPQPPGRAQQCRRAPSPRQQPRRLREGRSGRCMPRRRRLPGSRGPLRSLGLPCRCRLRPAAAPARGHCWRSPRRSNSSPVTSDPTRRPRQKSPRPRGPRRVFRRPIRPRCGRRSGRNQLVRLRGPPRCNSRRCPPGIPLISALPSRRCGRQHRPQPGVRRPAERAGDGPVTGRISCRDCSAARS